MVRKQREVGSGEQFKKDVLKAKAVYRKKRRTAILAVMTLVLAYVLIQTFLFVKQKKELNANLTNQAEQINNLEKESQVNEVVIDELKDPEFITDLVRQEYGLSYKGEIIFNLPLQDKFMQTTIKSIMDGNIQKGDNGSNRIDDSKIPALKKEDSSKTVKQNTETTNNASTKTTKNGNEEVSTNSTAKTTQSTSSNATTKKTTASSEIEESDSAE